MYKNFILEFIGAKGQEGSGSTERLHAKVGDHILLALCLFPVSSPPCGWQPFSFYYRNVACKSGALRITKEKQIITVYSNVSQLTFLCAARSHLEQFREYTRSWWDWIINYSTYERLTFCIYLQRDNKIYVIGIFVFLLTMSFMLIVWIIRKPI